MGSSPLSADQLVLVGEGGGRVHAVDDQVRLVAQDHVAERVAAMVGLAYRTRIMGSLALSLCHLAAGRVEGKAVALVVESDAPVDAPAEIPRT